MGSRLAGESCITSSLSNAQAAGMSTNPAAAAIQHAMVAAGFQRLEMDRLEAGCA